MKESYSLSQKRHKESDCRQMIHDCKSQPYPSLFFYLFRIFFFIEIFPQLKLTEEKTGHRPSSDDRICLWIFSEITQCHNNIITLFLKLISACFVL